jgi:Protein of unknown function (DUF669)
MGFSLDFNDTFEGGGKIADGDYEIIINRATEGNTPGGAEYIEFDLIIRNDVAQAHKSQHIFHKVWKAKDTGKYNMKTFNTIGKACKLQNGKSYKSLQDLLDDFYRKTALVNVKNETNEYNGKSYENSNVKYWSPSKLTGPVNHEFKKKEDMTASEMMNSGIDIQDDDLPF